MVDNPAGNTGTRATPTVEINGGNYGYRTPDALVAEMTEIVGDVPGVTAAAAAAHAPARSRSTPTPTR